MSNKVDISKEIKKAIQVKEDFIKYTMQRDKRLLGNRIAYIKYYLDVWLPKHEPEKLISEAVFELANYHLFISVKRVYELLKE